MIRLALVDDHNLFRKGLINLIELVSSDFSVEFEAANGLEMQSFLLSGQYCPDIILMDVNMPQMDGFQSVEWLGQHFPDIKVIVVSMAQSEESIVKMLRYGIKGYLGKDVEPKELIEALNTVYTKGFYYTDYLTGKLIYSLSHPSLNKDRHTDLNNLNERELKFIEWACTEYTYNEIAEKMFVSPKTVDGYRKVVFDKLQVKTRVGLALFAVKYNIVQL